ncbi:MAG: hypothetical protein LUH07_08690, partial [Lachnospiraceae bacterium]|nr:hypothetical protein [Lachnospiraceae bacterium]
SDGQSNGDSVIAGTTWQEQYDLGMQYLESGDYTAAVTAFTAAIEIDETDIRAYTGLVQAYGIFDIEEVISAAWQVAEILGDSDSGQEQEDGTVEEFFSTLMFLVEGGLKQGEYESAEAICSFIIEIDEKRVDAYIGRVEVYLELDEQEKALEDCRKALDLLQQGETGSITEDELEALIAELTEN